MKKHGLLKILGIVIFLIIVLSYILNGRSGVKAYVPIGDAALYIQSSLQYFFYVIIYVLAIGGFYGVLNKTPAYKKLLDNIVTSVKPLEKKFIFFVIIIFAVIASLTGMTLPLLIFVPFVVSIILLLGYDKLVAISATIISIMVGYTGGVFVSVLNPNTYETSTFESLVGAETKFANIFPKLLLLFAGIALLVYFVNKHIKNIADKKVKYELNDTKELLINEVKGNYKDIKTWPLITILSIILVILILGMIPWNSLFGIKVFTKFHEWLIGLSINEFAIIPNVISSNFPALGEWTASGDSLVYMMMTIILVVATLIISLISRLNIDEATDAFVEGMKKNLAPAGLIAVAYGILVCAYNNGFLEALITSYGKFNYGVSSLLTFLGCVLNVDIYYIVSGVFSPILNTVTDESIYSSLAILFQGIYGVFSIVGPTSLILIFGLSYMDIPYTTYLKYIWRFVLSLIILVALVTLLVVVL